MTIAEAVLRYGGTPLAQVLTARKLWDHLPGSRVAQAPQGHPSLALSFDLDYQADTDALPTLVALLHEVEVTATLFCIGRLVEQDPGPYAAAAENGQEIANHTWSHPDNPVLNPTNEFWHLTTDAMADEIARCQEALERYTGRRPCGFRTPHFKDAPRMMEALARQPEITYLSTALASRCPRPVPYFPVRGLPLGELSLHLPATGRDAGWPQLMIPLTACPGLRWSPFCSYSSIRRPADRQKGAGLHTVPEWERLWGIMLDRAHGARFASVYFDPMDVMRDDETRSAFRRMLLLARERGWDVVTLAEMERRWRPVAEAAFA